MSEITVDTVAYAKIILHAAKYPHCAINGILLADASKVRDGAKNQDVDIVDAVPLFHHSHYLSPMAEIALTQIETVAQTKNMIIAGYYAACENFRDNTVEKCPDLRIAEKIADNFPSAVFIVVDNQKFVKHLDTPAIKLHQFNEGKWKSKDVDKCLIDASKTLDAVSFLLQRKIQKEFIDFDNYLDDITLDWTNSEIEKLL